MFGQHETLIQTNFPWTALPIQVIFKASHFEVSRASGFLFQGPQVQLPAPTAAKYGLLAPVVVGSSYYLFWPPWVLQACTRDKKAKHSHTQNKKKCQSFYKNLKSSKVYMKGTIFLNLNYNPERFHIITTTCETAFCCSDMVANNLSTQEAEAKKWVPVQPGLHSELQTTKQARQHFYSSVSGFLFSRIAKDGGIALASLGLSMWPRSWPIFFLLVPPKCWGYRPGMGGKNFYNENVI